MRLHGERGCNWKVDLDDPKTYEHLPKTIDELRKKMLEEIGYSYVYVYFWHSDMRFGDQCDRIDELILDFADNDRSHRFNPTKKDILWYQEQLFLFGDEIENMC